MKVSNVFQATICTCCTSILVYFCSCATSAGFAQWTLPLGCLSSFP